MSSSAQTNANTVNSSYGRMKQEIETATRKMASDTDSGFKGMAKSISVSGRDAASSVSNIKSQMKSAFSNAGDWLKPAGTNIITGLWNGLKQKFRDVQNWFSGLGSWIQQHKGPKEYDLGLLVNNGRWIMQSLETGLRKGFPLIEDTVGEIADMIQGTDFDATASLSMDAKAVKAQPEDEGIRTFGQRKAKREQKETTVILMLDRTEFARAVYKANNDETQRVGLRLAGGYA
jgi:phage-related protein